MNRREMLIDGTIPALFWDKGSDRLLLLVHGMLSNKEDAAVVAAAEAALAAGMSALSFDLPGHGDRAAAFTPWDGLTDLLAAARFARTLAPTVDVFACSIGAYLALAALPDIDPGRLFLLSPMPDMALVVDGMLAAAGVTPARLERERRIELPDAPPLDWDYYRFVHARPVRPDRARPVHILRGGLDTLFPADALDTFAVRFGATLTVLPDAEHWFHTPDQLDALRAWLGAVLV